MTGSHDIQQAFLEMIRKKVSPNVSFVDEISEVLNISRDSAYRRIRGETTLDFREIQALCHKYDISLDSLLNLSTNNVTFSLRTVDYETYPFKKYFESILETIIMINKFDNKFLIYGAKDLPIMHNFLNDNVGKFKIFFWLKTYLHYPEYEDKVFTLEEPMDDLLNIGKKMLLGYARIPTTEIWSKETISLFLSQVEFYYESGIITKNLAVQLLDDYTGVIKHIKKECVEGVKFSVGSHPSAESGRYNFYINEIASPDNSIFFKMGDSRVLFLTFNTLNILSTSQDIICDQAESYYENMLKKSILVSGTSEKERNKFFNTLFQTIEAVRQKIGM